MKQIDCFCCSLIVMACLLFSSCNTVRGFGEDLTGSANFVQKKMSGDDAGSASSSSSNPPQWPK